MNAIRKIDFALVGILVLAAGLRCYDYREIGTRFWDEAYYISEARQMPAVFMPSLGFKAGNLIFFWAANPVLGRSSVTPLKVSLLTGVLTCLLLYLLGRRLFSRQAGLWAALVFAVLAYALHYSRSALVESNMMFLITLTLLCLAYWPRLPVVLLTGLFAGWTLSINQKAGFILLLPFLWNALKWLETRDRGALPGAATRQALFLVIALAVFFGINHLYPPQLPPFHHGNYFMKGLFQKARPDFLLFRTGLIGLLFTLFFTLGLIRAIKRRDAASLFVSLWFLPLFVVWSFNRHLEPRDFSGMVPAFALLAGLGIESFSRWGQQRFPAFRSAWGPALALWVTVYGVWASRDTWQLKSDVLPMAQYMNANRVPGVVCGQPLYSLYGIPVFILTPERPASPVVLDSLARAGWMLATDYMLGKTLLDNPPAWLARLLASPPEFEFAASASVNLPTVLETFQLDQAHRILQAPWARHIRLYALKNGAPFSE